MSTPNPLIPQGSIQHHSGSNVRIAVATVVAIHVVFFGGLLLQGCKREPKTEAGATDTNTPATAMNYPPMNSGTLGDTGLYYQGASSLPAAAPATNAGLAAAPAPAAAVPAGGLQSTTALDSLPQAPAAAAQDPWKQGAAAAATQSAPAAVEALGGKEYTVVRGDTFAKIAKTQGSTVAAIKQANPTVEPAKIRPGMKLIVPAGSAAAPAASAEGSGAPGATYTVKSGDTLTRIAKNHGITIGQLREANNLRTSRVNVGQKLKIPASKTAPAAPTNQAAAPGANPTF